MYLNYLKPIVIFCILILLLPSPAHPEGQKKQDMASVSWHITAEKATYDNTLNQYIAQGKVRITGGTTRIEADHAQYNQATQDVSVKGNVVLVSGDDSLTCSAMDLNLATEQGMIRKGTLFIKKNNMYIHGETIRKTGKFTYSADQGYITSCTQDIPDWKISAADIKVTIDGYGTARDATIWARQIPAFYLPVIAFPVKTERQTGLLAPKFGTSDRKGYEFEQPLFLALSDSTDATVYLHSMTERGVRAGLEYRYVLDNRSKGTLLLDLMDDRKIDDGTAATADYSYAVTPQRTNSERYWFRMKADHRLGGDFSAKLDLDVVSDPDYLREFDSGYTGFDPVQEIFESSYNRSMDEYNDMTRANRLNINRTWDRYSLNADLKWYDDLYAKVQDTEDTTLQSLPDVSFRAAVQPLGFQGLYYTLDTRTTYFYRKDRTLTETNGFRADFSPRIYYPLAVSTYLFVEPSAGFRETLWQTDDYPAGAGRVADSAHREIYDLSLKASSRLHRIFPGFGHILKIKHDIIPQIEYAYVPDVDQEDCPLFDTEDRIEKTNRITYSVINRFTAKKPRPVSKKEPGPAADTFLYEEMAWIKLSQSYYFNEEDNNDHDFSDIMLDSEWYLSRYLSLTSDLAWSPYDSRLNSFNTGATIRDNRGDSLTARYRYEREVSESVYVKTAVRLTDTTHLTYLFEADLENEKTIESEIGLTVKQSCWSLDLFYSDTRNDREIGFFITLHGLGGFGSK